jgi:SAM-dependent methyltransferase
MENARFTSRDAYREYQETIARRAILPLLKDGGIDLRDKRLLDVGCGTGGMTAVWAAGGARTVGLDIDAPRLAGLEGAFVAGDVTQAPFRDGSFDLVFAHDCLEHVRALDAALSEIARVLAPGGTAFVTFPPFFSAYGGHQQGSRLWLKFLPFGHLLPSRLWLSLAGDSPYASVFRGLSRLSLWRFESAVKTSPLANEKRFAFIIRPEVALRAGLPKIGASVLGRLPLLRELVVGGAFYVLRRGVDGGERKMRGQEAST